MTEMIAPKDLEAAARALVTAQETSLGIEVTMPVVYPDGKAVTVLVNVEGGDHVVHDAGFGAMYLTAAGVRLTTQLRQKLAGLATHYGCEFIQGRMTRRASVDQISLAIAMVANASRTVGDQTLEIRHRAARDFKEVVSERLRETIGSRVRRHQEIKGQSGTKYHVGNVVLDSNERLPVAFVESFANRTTISNHFMEFYDLAPAHPHVQRLSVYDQNEPFRDTDLSLLRDVSDVLNYNQSRRRFRQLQAA